MWTVNMEFLLITAFIVKHFLADFVMQTPFMYLNKGTLFHPGGLFHAAVHGIGTAAILWLALVDPAGSYELVVMAALFDSVTHYFIDFSKMKINTHYGWTSTNSYNFWVMLGLDQLLHYLTYVAIIYYFTQAIPV